jgi:POT family proton-dependent oligopeptide transporter
MGINIGALLAPLITGFLGEKVGWHYGFGAAGLGMILGLIQYRLTSSWLGPLGLQITRHSDPAVQTRQERRMKWGLGAALAALAVLLVLGLTGKLHIDSVTVARSMGYVIAGMAALYFLYLFTLAGLTLAEKKRAVAIVVLFVFATVFWSAFEQAPTSLNLFAADFTDRTVFGWEMPTLWLQSANSFFVIVFAPVFAALWIALGRRGKDLSSPAKFTLGLLFAAVGFCVMIFAAQKIQGGGVVKVSPWWLITSFFFQTIGELCLSPVGLSSMTKLAPRKFTGQMMGVWFMAAALGNLIAGLVGGHVNPENPAEMPALFTQTTLFLLGSAVVLGLLIVPIRRMMAEPQPEA